MIELERNGLIVKFPDVHPDAQLTITFQRTLRIPDDDGDYPLPPGLGSFPMRHVDDFARRVPESWLKRGGVMLPMYQSEALWIDFDTRWIDQHAHPYPFAIKIGAGKINAVTGDAWSNDLAPDPQDYVVAPEQPWLDGYCVEKGIIRQFVAMPLGAGYSAEEQITGDAEWGGIQIAVCPMKREAFERRFPERPPEPHAMRSYGIVSEVCDVDEKLGSADMGLAPGGRMRQEIYDDPYEFEEWDHDTRSRCFVHLANSLVWRSITAEDPPTAPFTSAEYTRAGLPWFEYYDDRGAALKGGDRLSKLKSVATLGEAKGDQPLPENESVTPEYVRQLRAGLRTSQVREGV